jgi:predicted AlkP superfamily pyrophosphatase or phosphodiesterase
MTGDVPSPNSRITPFAVAVAACGAALGLAAVLALVGSIIVAAGAATAFLAAGLWIAWRHAQRSGTDASRRQFLLGMGAVGLGAVAAGTGGVRVLDRLVGPGSAGAVDVMAREVGRDAMTMVKRGFMAERSGELQLILAPFNTSNYSHESEELEPRDPRSSHALAWGYLTRVPIVIHAPGLVRPGTFDDPASIADLAPTTAHLLGTSMAEADGGVLPGVERPARPPKVVVTLVIDGGGWNVLQHWPNAWPQLRALMGRSAVYRNATMGAFPAVTASSHATLGTGMFPARHGIVGHNLRYGGTIDKAWGVEGRADPTYLLAPTLADVWTEESGRRAWIGDIGYQIWHIGMIGSGGGRPLNRPPVAIYWVDSGRGQFVSQNPDLFRRPEVIPPREALTAKILRQYPGEAEDMDRGRRVCCTPPIVQYQGDVIVSTFDSEPVGQTEATSLLYINFKAPDYAGHLFNMQAPEEEAALTAVDAQIKRIRRLLESRFSPGEYVFIVTADHGQCPLPDDTGGVRLDPIQLDQDISRSYSNSLFRLVQDVKPSEVYLDRRALTDAGLSMSEIAARFAAYRYGQNIGPYVPVSAVQRGSLKAREFAGVFPATYLSALTESRIWALGSGRYATADPGLPPVTW